ncbi:MAG: elongation factor 4 [Candidatus Wildermuthbacteria bacterium]|nr:elongation factor 4 [Candidatus Wildermuthbacteria bacterium]
MQDNIRNFCIIAHIDHGKSTLADRFLELTHTIEKRKMKEQFLDQMDLEREKGITIKMQPVRMDYKGYALNLIDTPGHVDFTYEVSRSLAAVEGAILLVDATKGVQAQTLANLALARKQGLVIIPAINKIDSPLAKTQEVAAEVSKLLGVADQEIYRISAKEGTNVQELLDGVVEKVPPPKGNAQAPFRALIFDSTYDAFRGIITFARAVDGEISTGQKIFLLASGAEGAAKEVGYFIPQETQKDKLFCGEIGYIATGLKDSNDVRIGDTIAGVKTGVLPLEGYRTPKPMVFVSFYPQAVDDFDALKAALIQLKLNDPAFSFDMESKEALGRGFRCGFLGVLHSEIIAERVQREFGIDMVISRPSVEFRLIGKDGKEISVKTPVDWPDEQKIERMQEPWAMLDVLAPAAYLSQISQLVLSIGGVQGTVEDFGEGRLLAKYEIPLRQIVADLYDKLKSVSQGMASMDYEVAEWRPADLVKLEIWVAGKSEDALSAIVPRDSAYREGKNLVAKLKEVMPPQMFEIALQAVSGGRVIARETISAQRRDVTAPLYGGDVTRKRKLLDRQKRGKKELKEKGRVVIPPRVFLDLFRS